jgi:hypothetical protein
VPAIRPLNYFVQISLIFIGSAFIISVNFFPIIVVLAHNYHDKIDHRSLRHSHGDACGTVIQDPTAEEWAIDEQAEMDMFGKSLRYVLSLSLFRILNFKFSFCIWCLA